MMEKAKRNQEKTEKQREKLRRRDLEQQQKGAGSENAAEWRRISSHFAVAPLQASSTSP